MKELRKHFGDEDLAVLGQMVFTLRRPVLLLGFVQHRTLREVRLFAPHRQLLEPGLDVSKNPESGVEELKAFFEGEKNGGTERILYLASGVSSDFLLRLMESFDRGWVASCAALPDERFFNRCKVAVYDLSGREWLNVDAVRTRCWLMENILSEASKHSEHFETVLVGKLRLLALQARFFWELLSGGVTDPKTLFDLVGCRGSRDAQIILALCKKDYHLNPASLIDPNKLETTIRSLEGRNSTAPT
ncbi:MAG: hypothetical protein Q6352_015235 [Candidatus Freyrarchaeum guaymaensis]